MDASTKTMALTIATGVLKKGLIAVGMYLAGHGVIDSSMTETVVAVGMAGAGIVWSLWNDYGKAIVLSQLEMLKAKSLAQAAKLRENSITPVTVSQIAAQSPTLSASDVTKAVATLPTDIQANVKAG